jgi:hypothetical protein
MGSAAAAAGITELGDVAPHVEAAAVEISKRFGVTNIGGRASQGHINGSDHYTGHAIDVMVYTDKAKGDAIMKYALANWARLGIKYVIWYRVFHPSPTKSEPYIGTSPHTDHVHISFNKKPGVGGPAVDSLTGGTAGTGDNTLDGCLTVIYKFFGA